MEQYAAIEKIDELAVYWGGTVARINGSSMGESAKRSVRHVNAVWERREKEYVFTLRLADAHKHLRILYCTRSPRRAALRAGKRDRSWNRGHFSVLFEPLACRTSSKLHWNKNKTKQTEASRVLFIPLRIRIPGNSIWGTHCESNNPRAWFPMKRLLFTEGEGQSPS